MKNNRGFTLMEVLLSSFLSMMLLTSMVSAWMATSGAWKKEDTRSQIRHGIENVMERVKSDLRLSDSNKILYYPSDASTYTAISLPLVSKDANGYYALDNTGAIDWTKAKTVIYHVTKSGTGEKELRKTIINSYTTDQASRQTQLNNYASVDSTPVSGNGVSLSSSVLMKANDISLDIKSNTPTFDGYSAGVTKSGLTSFGNVRLAPGTHQIKFQVTGKNAASSGKGMGIDAISLAPSGCLQEAEELVVSSTSGDTALVEDMTQYGSWGGNHHLSYQSDSEGDFITLSTDYDQWLESNFDEMLHDTTMVSGSNPVLTLLSREAQSLTPAWTATAQTTSGLTPPDVSARDMSGTSVRAIIAGTSFTRSANMVRIKFSVPAGQTLTIDSAYFGLRNAGGNSPNFTAPTKLYFDNAPETDGTTDPVGSIASPGVSPGVTISNGEYVWSNWFICNIDASVAVPDYLVSIYTSSGTGTTWTPNPAGDTEGYSVLGDHASTTNDWAVIPGYNSEQSIFAVSEIATWIATGTATSQIYDTTLAAPGYTALSWIPTTPDASTVSFKIRTSANADMANATDWAALASYAASPANLAGLSKKRYVQYQVKLQGHTPYSGYPSVDNVKVAWPGQECVVQVSGIFTKKSNYGMFKVLVDGQPISNAMDVGITATKSDRGKDYSGSLHAQMRPRNTGK